MRGLDISKLPQERIAANQGLVARRQGPVMKTVGVLALQGDFEAHRKAIERAGACAVEVRTAEQLDACDGLIIPGGESTTMLKLLDIEKMTAAVRDFAGAQADVWDLRGGDSAGA